MEKNQEKITNKKNLMENINRYLKKITKLT